MLTCREVDEFDLKLRYRSLSSRNEKFAGMWRRRSFRAPFPDFPSKIINMPELSWLSIFSTNIGPISSLINFPTSCFVYYYILENTANMPPPEYNLEMCISNHRISNLKLCYAQVCKKPSVIFNSPFIKPLRFSKPVYTGIDWAETYSLNVGIRKLEACGSLSFIIKFILYSTRVLERVFVFS